MPRAAFNVLVLPYRRSTSTAFEYAVFHRPDPEMWQFVAGGGENDEVPFIAAQREAHEEAGIKVAEIAWLKLDSTASIPRTAFPTAQWPPSVYVVPEYCFAVNVGTNDLSISTEHDRFEWLDYNAARTRLTWDSNRVALWELQERLIGYAQGTPRRRGLPVG